MSTNFQDAKYVTILYNLEIILQNIFQDAKDIASQKSRYNLKSLLKTFFYFFF